MQPEKRAPHDVDLRPPRDVAHLFPPGGGREPDFGFTLPPPADEQADPAWWQLAGDTLPPPAAAVDPVVQVRVFDRDGALISAGTGFILASWPSTVLTARHVITEGSRPFAIRLRVRTAAGPYVLVSARAVACPALASAGDRFDCAAIGLSRNVLLGTRLQPAEPPGGVFPLRVEGFPTLDGRLDGVDLDGEATSNGLVVYQGGGGAGGMSGGPVIARGAVVGIHQGARDGRDQGLTLDFDVLSRSMTTSFDKAS
jgi:hypothetical protein